MVLVSACSCARISRQASATDNATPLGLQAPGLMITSASRKRLPCGRLGSDMIDISVMERMLLTAAARRTASRAGKFFWGLQDFRVYKWRDKVLNFEPLRLSACY